MTIGFALHSFKAPSRQSLLVTPKPDFENHSTDHVPAMLKNPFDDRQLAVETSRFPVPRFSKAAAPLAFLLLLTFGFSNYSLAQNENAPRPVFDESFSHWPVQLKINGRIIINREMTDVKPVDRMLQRIAQGKCFVFSTGESKLADRLESLCKEDNFTKSKCEVDELRSALENGNTVYLDAKCFTSEQLMKLQDQFQAFINNGGNLIADSTVGQTFGAIQSDGEPGLNLFPDCYLDCSYDGTKKSEDKITKRISARDRTVGIGIESQTMLVLSGRRLLSFGANANTLAISGNETVAATFQKIGTRGSQMADLTQWRRMAIDRKLPPFPPAEPRTPFVENGSLYIVGGGGMPDGLMWQMIDEAGGIKKAKCVYIPCSESDDVGERQRTVTMWKRMGVKHATLIHTKDRNQANSDDEFLEPLKDATMLWFGGGRQWNFADSYYGTEAHKLMKDVLHRGGVIGGSSAGASIQGRFLARATPIGNSDILAPGYERGGLGFLSGVAIDQHFSQRGRQKDMTKLVDKYPQMLGIGIDESTAIIVRKSRAEVVGRGRVFFYDRKQPADNEEQDYTAIAKGGAYDLIERKALETDE